MTLMAGPIDTRVNPTKVNELAMSKPIDWFAQNLIARVPMRYAGAGRRVYPGFVQLAAFMSMNIDRHRKAHLDLYENLAKGELEKAKTTKAFYDEYFAVLDLTAEFYLETVAWVFQEARLAKGELDLIAASASSPALSGARRCSPWRASATTSARSARRRRRTTCARASSPTCAATTCRRASATTASSPASAGRSRSTPSCAI